MEKIHTAILIEILGRPAEHIKEALKTISTRIAKEKGVKILDTAYHEPILIKDSKDMFTAFVEIDMKLDNLETYFGILVNYMPAHIELISPEKITLRNIDVNTLSSALVRRLHHYDSLTRRAIVEKENVLKKLKEVAPNLFEKSQSPKKDVKTKQIEKKTSKKKSNKKR